MHARDVAAVARKVDLGYDLDVAHGGVVDQLAHLTLREVAAVLLLPLAVDGAHGRVAAAETSDFGQLGVRQDLDAPPLVVGQVEVELVDLVVGHEVDIAAQGLGSDPRAGHVEHHAPVGVARRVLHLAAGEAHGQRAPPGVDLGRQQLKEGLYAAEDTPAVAARDLDPPGQNAQLVGFGPQPRFGAQHQRPLACARGVGGESQIVGEVIGERLQPLLGADNGCGVEREAAVELRHGAGRGQHGGKRRLGGRGAMHGTAEPACGKKGADHVRTNLCEQSYRFPPNMLTLLR